MLLLLLFFFVVSACPQATNPVCCVACYSCWWEVWSDFSHLQKRQNSASKNVCRTHLFFRSFPVTIKKVDRIITASLMYVVLFGTPETTRVTKNLNYLNSIILQYLLLRTAVQKSTQVITVSFEAAQQSLTGEQVQWLHKYPSHRQQNGWLLTSLVIHNSAKQTRSQMLHYVPMTCGF